MSQWIPPINKGLGKLTPDVWDAFREAAMFYQQNKESLEKLVTQRQRVEPIKFCLAKITGYTVAIENRQWRYEWEEVRLEAGDDDGTHEAFLTYNTRNYFGQWSMLYNSDRMRDAWNLAESTNSVNTSADINFVNPANLYDYELQPIKVNTIVVMYFFRSSRKYTSTSWPDEYGQVNPARIIPAFSLQSHFDGDCS